MITVGTWIWPRCAPRLLRVLAPCSSCIRIIPPGSFVMPKEAIELHSICAEREMAIVSDEVFLDYSAESKPHSTFAFDNAALAFTLSGLSKISALPQMKLAWLVASGPQPLVQRAMERLEIIADTFLSPGTPVQLALPKLLRIREEIQRQLQNRITANLAHLDSALSANKLLSRLDRQGGWYATLRVPATARTKISPYAARKTRCARASRPLLRFPSGRVSGGQPNRAGIRFSRRRAALARTFQFRSTVKPNPSVCAAA